MAEAQGSNGGQSASDAPGAPFTIILTFDPITDHLNIGGKAPSLHAMLDVMARATRVIEEKRRIQAAKELQAALHADAQVGNALAHMRLRG